MNYVFFRRFVRYSLRQAFIDYRLIDAALLGYFFYDPFFFLNRTFEKKYFRVEIWSRMLYTKSRPKFEEWK